MKTFIVILFLALIGTSSYAQEEVSALEKIFDKVWRSHNDQLEFVFALDDAFRAAPAGTLELIVRKTHSLNDENLYQKVKRDLLEGIIWIHMEEVKKSKDFPRLKMFLKRDQIANRNGRLILECYLPRKYRIAAASQECSFMSTAGATSADLEQAISGDAR